MLAALLWAPSVVYAASNSLSAPSATPTSGTTLTPITLTVRYDGKFAATAVFADVAGRSIALTRLGTPTAATWSGVVTLPPGTWPLSFHATVSQGASPSISGPTLTIAPLPSISTAPDAPAPSTAGPAAGSTGPPAPSGLPVAASASPGSAQTPVAAPAGSVPASQPAPAGHPAGAPPASDAPGPAAPSQADGPRRPADPARIGEPAARPEPPSRERDGERTAQALAAIALVGVTALAIIGSALVAGRRRRPEEEEPPASELATTILARRTARRGRHRLPEDPIVAAIRIGEAQAEPGEPRPARQRRRPARRG
jgi:hypothetical protein